MSKKLQAAISKLAALYEYGELEASTDPSAWLETVADEVRDLRTRLAAAEEAVKHAYEQGKADHERMLEEATARAGRHKMQLKRTREELAEIAKNREELVWQVYDAVEGRNAARAEVERVREERADVLVKLITAEEALAFAACVIKSGEPWTDTCERVIGGALKGGDEG
jgi:chromosome segregation ATPase